MCNDPVIDELTGEYTNCHFYKRKGCVALKKWYMPKGKEHCRGCPFFKTSKMFYADAAAADARLRRICPDPDYTYERRIVIPVSDPEDILLMRNKGMTIAEIAAATKINERQIQRIISRTKKDGV